MANDTSRCRLTANISRAGGVLVWFLKTCDSSSREDTWCSYLLVRSSRFVAAKARSRRGSKLQMKLVGWPGSAMGGGARVATWVVLLSHLNHTRSVSYDQAKSQIQVSAAQSPGMALRVMRSCKLWYGNRIGLICEFVWNWKPAKAGKPREAHTPDKCSIMAQF